MARVLLLIPSRTYRTHDFMAAASRLGIEVVVGSEHRPALASLMEGRHLKLDFGDIPQSTARIVDFSKTHPLASVVAVDDGGTMLAASAAAALGIPHSPIDAVEAARDKARMRLGRRTLLGHVRHTAEVLGLDVRVIRKDLVPRCGPLGGIYTALITSTHDAEVFLSCDMPFVTPALLRSIVRAAGPMFVEHEGLAGFPLMLSTENLGLIQNEIRAGRLSLQNLAKRLRAKRLRLDDLEARQLFNVNTPADWEEAQRRRAELPL